MIVETAAPHVLTGVSVEEDSKSAAMELAAALQGVEAEIVLFFASSHYDIGLLGRELQKHFPGSLVLGCTTAGEIHEHRCLRRSVCGFALPRETFSISLRPMPSLSNFDMQAGQKLVSDMVAELSDHLVAPINGNTFAMLLVDGMSRLEEIVLSAIHMEIGDIPLFGGSAGDDLKFDKTAIFHDGDAHDDIAVFCLINTVCPFRIFSTQHFVASDRKMVITEADVATRCVSEINAAPAAKEYARLVGIDYDCLDPMTFATHPVMVRVGGAYYVRSIQNVDQNDNLRFFCAIDEGLVLTLAEGVDMVENLSQTFDDIRLHVGEPQLVIGCDCIFRRLEYEQDPKVATKVANLFKQNRVIGFNTYGEQFGGMHVNQTFTGVAIGYPQSKGG